MKCPLRLEGKGGLLKFLCESFLSSWLPHCLSMQSFQDSVILSTVCTLPSFQTPSCNKFSAPGYLMKASLPLSNTKRITEKGYKVENHSGWRSLINWSWKEGGKLTCQDLGWMLGHLSSHFNLSATCLVSCHYPTLLVGKQTSRKRKWGHTARVWQSQDWNLGISMFFSVFLSCSWKRHIKLQNNNEQKPWLRSKCVNLTGYHPGKIKSNTLVIYFII